MRKFDSLNVTSDRLCNFNRLVYIINCIFWTKSLKQNHHTQTECNLKLVTGQKHSCVASQHVMIPQNKHNSVHVHSSERITGKPRSSCALCAHVTTEAKPTVFLTQLALCLNERRARVAGCWQLFTNAAFGVTNRCTHHTVQRFTEKRGSYDKNYHIVRGFVRILLSFLMLLLILKLRAQPPFRVRKS